MSLWKRSIVPAVLVALCTGYALGWEPEKPSRLIGKDRTITVGPGRTLYEVARAEGYALEHLAEANGLPVSNAAVTRSQLVVPSRRILPQEAPSEGIVVNIPERGFYVFSSNKAARFFPIAMGQPGRFATPTGTFSILEKVKDPAWYAPEWAGLGENNVVPAGPDNPLGDRWIGLSSSGLGMHSTNNPASIGSATSHGCMRMYPEIARTVFDLVEVGWPVRIEYRLHRVALEPDGIYVSSFPDPYSQGGRREQLTQGFENLDLGGFTDLVELEEPLRRVDGVARKVVDLNPRTWVGNDKFPAVVLGGKVFLTTASLQKLGVGQTFHLAENEVVLVYNDREAVVPLRLAENNPKTLPSPDRCAFLSRGSAWYPAKDVLNALNIKYEWKGKEKILRLYP